MFVSDHYCVYGNINVYCVYKCLYLIITLSQLVTISFVASSVHTTAAGTAL